MVVRGGFQSTVTRAVWLFWEGWCTQSTKKPPPPKNHSPAGRDGMGSLGAWGPSCEGEVLLWLALSLSLFLSHSCLADSSAWYVTVGEGSGIYVHALLVWVRAHASQLRPLLALHLVLFFFFPPPLPAHFSMDARLGPSCTSVSPPCSPPGPQPSVPKTDDYSTQPTHTPTHPVLSFLGPVPSSPALLCSPPPLAPKAQSQHTLALTLTFARNRPVFSSSAPHRDCHLRPPTTILSFSYPHTAASHLFSSCSVAMAA